MTKFILIFTIAVQLTFISACNIIPKQLSSVEKRDEKLQEAQLAELVALTEEWEAMKPALVNLIAFEADLQYLLNNVDQSNDKLKNTTELQLAVESEEQTAAYEAMTFDDSDDLTKDFSDKTEELDKLGKTPIFADIELLEQLETSAKKIAVDLPVDATKDVSGNAQDSLSVEVFAAEETLQNMSESNTAEANVSLPVIEYLRDNDNAFGTIPIPDVKILGNDGVGNNTSKFASGQTTYRPSAAPMTRIIDHTNLQQGNIDEKFRKIPVNNVSNSQDTQAEINSKFSEPNFSNEDKFRRADMSVINDPRRIVGKAFPGASKVNAQLNLKQQRSCSTNKVSVGVGYALHLASYSSRKSALDGWETLTTEFSEQLCGLLPLTETVTVNDRLFFSLRAGSFASEQMANAACAIFASKSQYCRATRFTGERLL